MRVVNNLRIVQKLCIPLALVLAVVAGIVWQAWSGMEALIGASQHMVEVVAARRSASLALAAAVNDATINEKNAILDTREEARDDYGAAWRAAMERTRQAAERLVALADTPERRRSSEQLRGDVEAYAQISARVMSLVLHEDYAGAVRLTTTEGRNARHALTKAVEERIATAGRELADAQVEARELGRATTVRLLAVAGAALPPPSSCSAPWSC